MPYSTPTAHSPPRPSRCARCRAMSLWPHDNAMIAAGLARYGFRDAALRLFASWLAAATFFELHRLPELFCGFHREHGQGPTPYPVACSPQAWAAGSLFMLLGACLG